MEAGRISSRGRVGDAREWDEEGYRRSILLERELSSRIVFRTAFAPSENPNPEIVLVASSDGSLSAYSISPCIASCPRPMLRSKETDQKAAPEVLSAGPLCSFQAHKGPSYDLKLYGNDEEALLLSCGDDGYIRGWKWAEVHMAAVQGSNKGEKLSPILELANPQKEGPWGALSPIPENNAIAVDKEDGSLFSAAGDSCAYWWDMVCILLRRQAKGKLSSRGTQIISILLLCVNPAIRLLLVLKMALQGYGTAEVEDVLKSYILRRAAS